MKSIVFLSVVLVFSLSLKAQKVSRKSFSINHVEYPTLAVENLQKIKVQINFPDASVNQDTMRKYQGSMQILYKDGAEQLSKMKEYSYKPIEIVNENYDILVDVAFAKPEFGKKELHDANCSTPKNPDCKSYFYRVNHRLTTIVKISDKTGKTLDIWTEPAENSIQFGNEQIETVVKTDIGTEASVYSLKFGDVKYLEGVYTDVGETLVNRTAILKQMKKVIESLYTRIYFKDAKLSLKLGTGKGKDYDYSELNAVLDKAIAVIEKKEFESLDESIVVWKKYLEQSSLLDNKAMINKKVTAILNGNLSIAYMLQKNFNEATKYATTYNKLSMELNEQATFSDAGQSIRVIKLIEAERKAQETNGQIALPFERKKALNIKAEIGRRKKNIAYDLYTMEDKSVEFYDEYNKLKQAEEAMAPKPAGNDNPYLDKVQITSTQGAMLMLNAFANSDIVGKPMPAEIAELEDLKQLLANGLKFTSLPENIGNLTKLTKLNLKGNNLETIPESIGNCSELSTLNLANNNLSSLPESIKNCTKLKSVVLSGNNISAGELEKIKSWLPAKCKLK